MLTLEILKSRRRILIIGFLLCIALDVWAGYSLYNDTDIDIPKILITAMAFFMSAVYFFLILLENKKIKTKKAKLVREDEELNWLYRAEQGDETLPPEVLKHYKHIKELEAMCAEKEKDISKIRSNIDFLHKTIIDYMDYIPKKGE